MDSLKIGRIYSGVISKRPVRYIGPELATQTTEYNYGEIETKRIILHQFEYFLPEDLHKPSGGILGYGQTIEEVLQEKYRLVKNLDVLYGST